MRQRLRRFVPIFVIAFLVHLLAPVAWSWAAAMAVSDPLAAAEICHSDGGAPVDSTDQMGDRLNCAMVCIAHAAVAPDTPRHVVVAAPYREAAGIAWQNCSQGFRARHRGAVAQARAPPSLS